MPKKKLITKEEWAFFFKAAVVASLFFGILSAAIAYFSRPEEVGRTLPRENIFEGTGAGSLSNDLIYSDFIFPEEGGSFGELGWSFQRDLHPKWIPRDVQKYWQDPEKFEIRKLPEKNDDLIREILGGP